MPESPNFGNKVDKQGNTIYLHYGFETEQYPLNENRFPAMHKIMYSLVLKTIFNEY